METKNGFHVYHTDEQRYWMLRSGITRLYSSACRWYELAYPFGVKVITEEMFDFGQVLNEKYLIAKDAMRG